MNYSIRSYRGVGKQASASPLNSVRRQGIVHDPLEPIGNNGKNSTSNPTTTYSRTSQVSAEVRRDRAQEYFMLAANDVDQRTIIVRSAQTDVLLSKLLWMRYGGQPHELRTCRLEIINRNIEYIHASMQWLQHGEDPLLRNAPPLRNPLLEGMGLSLVTILQEGWNVQSKGIASTLTLNGENRAAMRTMRRNEPGSPVLFGLCRGAWSLTVGVGLVVLSVHNSTE